MSTEQTKETMKPYPDKGFASCEVFNLPVLELGFGEEWIAYVRGENEAEARTTATIFSEAFNIHKEIGLTPRQLKNKADNFESVAKLIKTLNVKLKTENKELKEQYNDIRNNAYNASVDNAKLIGQITELKEQRDELLQVAQNVIYWHGAQSFLAEEPRRLLNDAILKYSGKQD